jgi:hypothetical protein
VRPHTARTVRLRLRSAFKWPFIRGILEYAFALYLKPTE